MQRLLILLFFGFMTSSCSSKKFLKTVDSVDISRFMGKWYVWTGRTTFLEKGAHNSIEIYTLNSEKNRIDVDFSFNKGSFSGKLKKLPQKAWIENSITNAHWKIQLFWPLKADYLIIALDKDYQWTAIGVPSGDYLWIMGREPFASDQELNDIVKKVELIGYPTNDLNRVLQDGNR